MQGQSKQQFECKFVRLGQGWLAPEKAAERTYRDVVAQHAREGWRLVRIFALGVGGYGSARYDEVVLERPFVS